MTAVALLILRRVGTAALTLLLVSVVVFSISAMLPGDFAQETLGQSATPEAVAALRTKLGLDQPAPIRYLHWLSGLLMGDLGHSMANDLPVRDLVSERLPKSLMLAGLTAALAVPLALAIGTLSAIHRGRRLDRILNVITLSMVAAPEFLVATLAVLVFAVKLRLLPSLTLIPQNAGLLEVLQAYALPVMTLAFVVVAQMARMTRSALVDQLSKPYVDMARLKGLRSGQIILRHVVPNAAGPIVNAMALSLSYLLGGAIIVETIFNYPGLASLMVDAVTSRDMPLLLACTMIFCVAYLALLLIADICSILANPRLRAS